MQGNLFALSYIRKTTISFVLSLCVSAWNISGNNGQIFMNLWIWLISKFCRENLCDFISRNNVFFSDTFVEGIITGILLAIVFSGNICLLYNLTWENLAQPDTA